MIRRIAASYVVAFLIVAAVLSATGGGSTLSTFSQLSDDPNSACTYIDGDCILVPRYDNIYCRATETDSNVIIDMANAESADAFNAWTIQKEVTNINSEDIELVARAAKSISGGQVKITVDHPPGYAQDVTREIGFGFLSDTDWTPIVGGSNSHPGLVSRKDPRFDRGSIVKVTVQKGVLGSKPDPGDIQLSVNYQRYDLEVSGTSPLTVAKNTCAIDAIGKQAAVWGWKRSALQDARNRGDVRNGRLMFGKFFSVVTGAEMAVNPSQAIDTDGDGTPDEYVVRESGSGFLVYPIVESNQDGVLYADPQRKRVDTSIKCLPSSPYCSADGTTVLDDPSEKELDRFQGDIIGWLPSRDQGEVCKWRKTTDGSLATVECKQIPSCGQGEFLNDQYQCVQQDLVTPAVATGGMSIWLIIVAAFLGTLVLGTFLFAGILTLGP